MTTRSPPSLPIQSMQVVLRAHVQGRGFVEGASDVVWAEIFDVEDAHLSATLDAVISMRPSQDELNLVLGRLLLGHLRKRAGQNDQPEDLLEMCLRRLVRRVTESGECQSTAPAAVCLTNIHNAIAFDQAGDHEVLSDG